VALYEILVNSDRLRDQIIANVPPTHLKREAIQLGMSTLRMSGVRKIRDGVTTIEEVLSATVSYSDE